MLHSVSMSLFKVKTFCSNAYYLINHEFVFHSALLKSFNFPELKYSAHVSYAIKRFLNVNSYKFCDKKIFEPILPGHPDWSTLTKNDPLLENKLKLIQMEYQVLKDTEIDIPKNMKLNFWKEIILLPTATERRKYLHYLFLNEKHGENMVEKKKEKRKAMDIKRAERQSCLEKGEIVYGLWLNSYMYYYSEKRLHDHQLYKLVHAMVFGSKLVVDVSYDSYMNRHECKDTAKQITLLFTANRSHKSPFDLYICGLQPETPTYDFLLKNVPTILEPTFPVNITSHSYLDLFPKERLVYLTPNCTYEMREYDYEDIYIIGGIVDKHNKEPVTMAKAKREGLRMAKLPLDYYFRWSSGSGKSLTLNQILSIMLDVKETGNMQTALQNHVPRRKIAGEISNTPPKTQSLRNVPSWWDKSVEDRDGIRKKYICLEAFRTPD